jgi:hypothetical protein
MQRIIAILRFWPVQLRSANYSREKERLRSQKYFGASSHMLDDIGEMIDGYNGNDNNDGGGGGSSSSSSSSGGGGSTGPFRPCTTRRDRNVDYLEQQHPELPFALAVSRMKWNVPMKVIKHLYRDQGLTEVGAFLELWADAERRAALLRDLSAKKLAGIGPGSIAEKHLNLAQDVNMTTQLTEPELYNDELGIVTVLQRHADDLGLEMQAVGGTRRGVLNAHDLGGSVSQSVSQSISQPVAPFFRPLG